ncbi:tyrosine-type recombinase/integrase [Photobacterium damselae]|uniref:phage integrase n=1 Tax=Photobacterium damselae TaxID=38293 RepID=UPI000D661F54|nr:tyrosine-type recombinase/integrase [Photobacterium damselae]AWK83534.1 integrase [Photobacterium damselae]
MSIKSIPNGYEVDCRPQGRCGKRYRKKFKTKAEATQYERWLLATRTQKGWLEKPKDKRRLNDLIELWYIYKGQQLKSGHSNKLKLYALSRELGNPRACNISKRMFADYRAKRLSDGISISTINRTQNLLSGVFTTLIDIEEYFSEHPIKGMVRPKPKAREMSFLTMEEVKRLLNALEGDALNVAKLCLSTGARWSEAANLKGSNLQSNRVTFVDTKNGKNRTIPISPELLADIYTGKNGNLFDVSYTEFRNTIHSLGFDLPRGQASHVLRHTFASHFMMNGGNILTLQKILGHSTITQTMTYAHLAPDYLNEAMELNPLSTI